MNNWKVCIKAHILWEATQLIDKISHLFSLKYMLRSNQSRRFLKKLQASENIWTLVHRLVCTNFDSGQKLLSPHKF